MRDTIRVDVPIEDILEYLADCIDWTFDDKVYTFTRGDREYSVIFKETGILCRDCGRWMCMVTNPQGQKGWGCLHCHPEYKEVVE